MANSSLVVLGLLMIIGMFFFSNVMITPQQRSQIDLANSACGSAFGKIGSAISGQVAEGCQQATIYNQVLSLSGPVYLFGFILLLVGLVIGGKKEIIRERVVKQPKIRQQAREESEEEIDEVNPKVKEAKESNEEKTRESKKLKFCSDCGAKVKGKFCPDCGEKI